jgi:hypothetical protein
MYLPALEPASTHLVPLFFTAFAAKIPTSKRMWYGCTRSRISTQGFNHPWTPPCLPPPSLHRSVQSRSSRQPRVAVCRVPDLARSLEGSTTVAASMHVTDRRRPQPGKPITCQRDSRPSICFPSRWQQAQHGRVTQLHRKRKRKRKIDEPYPQMHARYTSTINQRKMKENDGAPCSTEPDFDCRQLHVPC